MNIKIEMKPEMRKKVLVSTEKKKKMNIKIEMKLLNLKKTKLFTVRTFFSF